MEGHLITKDHYLEAIQIFNWATKDHFVMWFTGGTERHRRTESILPRLVRQQKIKTYRLGKKLVYIAPRLNKGNGRYFKVAHGLGCTEGLVRIWRSRMDCTIIPDRYFCGFGIVPEWGLLYPNKTLLLYEYCTRDNFERSAVVKSKIRRYKDYLPAIEQKFDGHGIILFVVDVERETVNKYVDGQIPVGEQFFFTDFGTFKDVPLGKQLTAPIYFWGEDGETYPLAKTC